VILIPLLLLLFGSAPGDVWRTLWEDEVIDSLVLTFTCGLVATLAGIVFGTPLAYLLAKYRFRGKEIVQGIVDIPIVIPHPVVGIALLLVLSGLPRGNSPVGHWTGIVLAMFFVSVSLLVNTLQEGFRSIPVQMEWTSRSLGVSPAGTFFRVSLPLVRQNLIAGGIMMWARSISEFGAIVILVYNPKVASVLIYERFTTYGLAHSLPVAVILVWTSLTLFLVMRTVQGKGYRVSR
jgi:molybdate/tungstate transport system permease protein